MSCSVFTDAQVEQFFLDTKITQENDIEEIVQLLKTHRPELLKHLIDTYALRDSKPVGTQEFPISTLYESPPEVQKLKTWIRKVESTCLPKIGDDIYVPTINGDFIGGLARVTNIVGEYVTVEEHNRVNYRWKNSLDKLQGELKVQFGNRRAYHAGVI